MKETKVNVMLGNVIKENEIKEKFSLCGYVNVTPTNIMPRIVVYGNIQDSFNLINEM